jgi:ribosome maturation factor RimP
MVRRESMRALQPDIEERLAHSEPDVEVLLAEIVGGHRIRVFIDHPDGVTLALCERVTSHLGYLRERYAIEVSSPGRERPLTKPDHFRRFVGCRARIRTRPPCVGSEGFAVVGADGSRGRRRSVTGELVGASESEITVAAEGSIIAIPYSQIRRSHLVEE